MTETIVPQKRVITLPGLGRAGLVWLIPALEFAFLRYALHCFLQMRLGFVDFRDADFWVPSLAAYFILMALFRGGRALALKFRPGFFAANVVFFLLFYIFSAEFSVISFVFPTAAVTAWFGLFALTVLSGFGCFVKSESLALLFRRQILFPTLVAAVLFLGLFRLAAPIWPAFAETLTTLLNHGFGLGFNGRAIATFTVTGYLRLAHPDFVLRIGREAAGLESLVFFSQVFVFYFALARLKLTRPKLNWAEWLLNFSLGLSLMYFLNAFRIFFLFTMGLWATAHFGSRNASEWLKPFFNSYVGWSWYVTSCLAYLLAFERFLRFSRFSHIRRENIRAWNLIKNWSVLSSWGFTFGVLILSPSFSWGAAPVDPRENHVSKDLAPSATCCWCVTKWNEQNNVTPYSGTSTCEKMSGGFQYTACKRVEVEGKDCSFVSVSRGSGGIRCSTHELFFKGGEKRVQIKGPDYSICQAREIANALGSDVSLQTERMGGGVARDRNGRVAGRGESTCSCGADGPGRCAAVKSGNGGGQRISREIPRGEHDCINTCRAILADSDAFQECSHFSH